MINLITIYLDQGCHGYDPIVHHIRPMVDMGELFFNALFFI